MKKVIVLIGGNSSEHEVSIVSGINVFKKIEGYEKNIIYLDKENIPFYIEKDFFEKDVDITYIPKIKEKIENFESELKLYDIVFPVMHGSFGEDGKLQGILEKNNLKYAGCKLLSSALCMDKVYAKYVFENAGLNVAKYIYLKKDFKDKIFNFEKGNIEEVDLELIDKRIVEKLKYPVFVKPANSGSSVGVSKVSRKEDLEKAINLAFKEDDKILIEEALIGKEIECAILEKDDELFASKIGEILSAENFYTFNAKYLNAESKTVILEAREELIKKIQETAKYAFRLMDCKGISRVDMFLIEDKIYINEINTMPGFTAISMYPQLLVASGLKESEFLKAIIENYRN